MAVRLHVAEDSAGTLDDVERLRHEEVHLARDDMTLASQGAEVSSYEDDNQKVVGALSAVGATKM